MKKLYIMVGVPGSGKGYWIKNNLPAAQVCSADHYFYTLGNGTYAFDPTQLGAAHTACITNAQRAMRSGVSEVVIDNTNLVAKHMRPYLDAAEENGYEVEIIRITPAGGMTEAYTRNQHGVPEEAHNRMWNQFGLRSLPEGVKVREVRNNMEDYGV